MIEFRATRENGADALGALDLTPAKEAYETLRNDDMAGWLDVPVYADELEKIKSAARKINHESDYLVCVGIGGSYLGHKAVIEALLPENHEKILYAGNSLSTFALDQVLEKIEGKNFSVLVISKSGTTLEPSLAFDILKEKLKERYHEDWNRRVYATTDARSGALHDEAIANGYETFVVPDDIGGRYSVLTAVGLLPLAVAGVDLGELLDGAKIESRAIARALAIASGDQKILAPLAYATLRQEYHARYFDVEILASFDPRLQSFQEWWKQLFGESEGKDGRGIFPASVSYTTDLHSLGQYLQQGRRNIFETFLKIPPDNKYNDAAERATVKAHQDGGLPIFEIAMEHLNARNLGALIYFFELSCAISARLQGANPFDQPGVEAYKKNMRELLES